MKMQSSIFVIHGRDLRARDRVVGILHKLRTTPVYLEREAAIGQTIIELVEKHSEANCCVAVLTADDIGYLKNDVANAKPRARQNVIFEVGFLMARLGRSRVILLVDDIELPSDLDGIKYYSRSMNDEKLRMNLAKEFQQLKDIQFEL